MKNAMVLVLMAMLWACSSEPTVDDGGKPGVEDRSVQPAKPIGPGTAGTKPSQIPEKPIGPGAGTRDPLKDPGSVLSKRSVFYDYDSDAVKDEFRPIIQAHAKYLASNPNARMLIQGNCDERGSREYNLALGQRRAEAVKKVMTVLGVTDGRIETVSYGEEKPAASGHDEQAWAQNRRADIKYAGE